MMKQNIMMALIAASMSLSASAQNNGKQPEAVAQNSYQGHFTRSLHDVMQDVSQRWGVRFKYNVDTIGKQLPYADFRIKPYSLEETLTNICKYFDFNWWKQNGNEVTVDTDNDVEYEIKIDYDETEHNDGTYRGKHVFVGKCAK